MQTARVIVCKVGRLGELRKILDTNLSQLQDQDGSMSPEDKDFDLNQRQTAAPRGLDRGQHSPSLKIASVNQNFEDSVELENEGKLDMSRHCQAKTSIDLN